MSGPLTIWEDPIPDEEYTVSWDPALGLRADYAEGFVIKHAPLTVVAHYRSNRVKPDRAGVIAYLLALYYNGARLVVERTGCGVATLTILENGHPEYPQMGDGATQIWSMKLRQPRNPPTSRTALVWERLAR
jgi:hypothetical protein